MNMDLAPIDAMSGARVPERASRVSADLRQLRDVTGKVIGSVFFGTLLKSMRESSLKGPYGHGGRGEDAFAAQLHERYAEQVGTSLRGGVAEAIFGRFKHQQELFSAQRKLDQGMRI